MINKLIMEEAIKKFLFHCEFEKRLSKKTLKAYSIDLEQFRMQMFNQGLSCIGLVGKTELKNYLHSISTFKPKTTKRKVASIKAFFNFLEYEELIDVNPLRKIRISIKEPLVLPQVMNIQEAIKLFSLVYSEVENYKVNKERNGYRDRVRDIAVFELLFGTGVRVSELCSLRYSDIGIGYSSICVNGKGSKERNIKIINEDIIKALKNYYSLFSEQINEGGFFFINRCGRRLSEQSVRLMIRKYRKKGNINKNITPHMFRHTFATLLLEQDVDIKYIQNILGHSSIMTTQIYTHVSTEKQTDILQNKHPRNEFSFIGYNK
jgi:integrase/recombinase XerD